MVGVLSNMWAYKRLAAYTLSVSVVVMSPVFGATINKTVCVGNVNLTLGGQSIPFWGFTSTCGGGGGMGGSSGGATIPGPPIEVGAGDTLNLTLNMMMAPGEAAPYNGHTIHLHGADVPTSEDGVPHTGASVNGDTYTWNATNEMTGSYPYHCHVHTVKHLEMGMYGAIIIRPKDSAGNFLNRITSDAATAYDYSQIYLLSTVDPAYHTAVGDSTVFADYNPKYFLIEGKEGKSTSAPAVSLTAAPGKKVALRLIGMHSVNSTFQIKDAGGAAKPFTVYVQDGRRWPTPQSLTSIDIGPAQRFDILFTLPSSTGTWYPQVTYKKIRDNAAYATVYGKVSF